MDKSLFESMAGLTTRELDTLGKRLHADGKFGADYAPMKKGDKISFIASEALKIHAGESNDAALHLKMLAAGIIAGRAEGGFDDADNASDSNATSAGMEGDKPLEPHENKATEGGTNGFGFEGQQSQGDKKSACPEGDNCQFHGGGECDSFEHTGECPECGVEYANASSHIENDDGSKCSMEQKLDQHHAPSQGQGNGESQSQQEPDPSKMDLITLIKTVTHKEHDGTFLEVGKAFHRAEGIVRQVAWAAQAAHEEATQAKADAESALSLVKEAKRKKLATAENLVIQFPTCPPVNLAGKHPVIFPQLMALMSLPDGIRQPVMLYGDAGGGKSTVAEQVADAFGLFPESYGAVSCTGDMTSGKINGRILPIGNGVYVPSDLVRLLQVGKPFMYVWDEFDVAPPEIKIGANTMLAQGAIYVEERSFADLPVRLVVPPRSMFISAGNTINGPDAIYTSRAMPDGAANDRWIILRMDSDPRVQATILGAPYTPLDTWIPQQRTEDELRAELLAANTWLLEVKQNVAKKKIRRLVTDRAALRARALLTAGFTMDETKDVVLAGWTPDEKAMVGIGG